MSILVIDTSYHQDPKDIDYDVLYSRIDGVIGRVGYGTGAPGKFEGADPAWERTYAEAKARGVPVGGYHYIVEYKPVDEQLDVVYEALEGKELELGFWADVEIEGGTVPDLTRPTVVDYITKAEAQLGEVGIYTGAWCWNPIMGADNPYSGRRLWVSGYVTGSPPMPYGWSKYWMWQYTSSGRLNGYAGNLDMNRISDEKWKQWIGVTLPPEYAEPLDVPLFSQRDSRWASDKLGISSVTIGAYGCLITATAMVCKFYGKDTDPGRINQDLINVGGYVDGNLLRYNAVTDIWQDIEVDWDLFITNPTDAQIDAVLEREIPVIVQVDYNPHTSQLEQHWVVVIGKDSTGYIIADPIDGRVGSLSRYTDRAYRMAVYQQVGQEVDVLFRIRVLAGALNVRSTPEYIADGSNVIGRLYKGTERDVYEVNADNGWLRIGTSAWISGSPAYVERINTTPALTLEERVARLEKEVFGA